MFRAGMNRRRSLTDLDNTIAMIVIIGTTRTMTKRGGKSEKSSKNPEAEMARISAGHRMMESRKR